MFLKNATGADRSEFLQDPGITKLLLLALPYYLSDNTDREINIVHLENKHCTQ